MSVGDDPRASERVLRRAATRVHCASCRRILPTGCVVCAACELARLLDADADGCRCLRPVPIRCYMRRWACGLCRRWI